MQEPIGMAPAFAGVDTHKDTNMLALADALGRPIGTWEFPCDPAGYQALADAIADVSVPVGVEGTRSYGAGLASALEERGFSVYEVVRPRREQRRRGKTDALDALAACENVAAGRCLPAKRLEGRVEELRWLMAVREQVVAHATRLACCLDSLLVTAPAPLRERWRGLAGAARMGAIAASRPRDRAGRSLRLLARRWCDAREQADELEAEIRDAVAGSFPMLLGAPCVGAISAARLVLAAGSNPERMRGEAAFSMLCGTSPIPASSGKTSRHRLNRGGDRQANRAIHEIARARMSRDERTQSYIARKMSGGMSKREAVRCLCRYIAREVFKLMTGPQEMPCDQAGLAPRRKALGVSQAEAARETGLTRSKIARLEGLVEYCTEALERYHAFLLERELEAGLDNI